MHLPVRVHFAGRVLPVTVELVRLARGRCTLEGVTARMGARVAFGFTLPEGTVCLARGRVSRVEPRGFEVTITATNEALQTFFDDLSTRLDIHAA